jgi:hypothetical protein
MDDVNCVESVQTRPPLQNVLLVWYTLPLLDDSLPLDCFNYQLNAQFIYSVIIYITL